MSFTPIVVGTGLTGYSYLTRTRESQQEVFEKSSLMSRDMEAFDQRISSIKTADQLIDDRQLLRVALGAFGLDADLNNRAFIQKVLESDPAEPRSFANRLGDKRYLALAKTFGFASADGPQIATNALPADLSERLADVKSPDDLLSDRSLLRETLSGFGLEGDERNVYFLQSVFESDLSDPNSFANRLSDTRYAKLAAALDFAGRDVPPGGVSGFVSEFSGVIDELDSADDLLGNSRLMGVALDLFGLPVRDNAFLRDVLTSDPEDEASFAASLADKRYLALSNAFGFGATVEAPVDPSAAEGGEGAEEGAPVEEPKSKAQVFVELMAESVNRITSPKDVVQATDIYYATIDFFGLREAHTSKTLANTNARAFMERVLDSDSADPLSLAGQLPDKRYAAMARAFGFNQAESEHVYPAGFAEEITRRYADRQFEVKVGETDPNMRLALSLERELNRVVDSTASPTAQWYTVMSTPPLRQVFETALVLPSSFAMLDLDRQLVDFETRSESMFGTNKVADFTDPENLDALRNRFLSFSAMNQTQAAAGPTNAALAILSNAG